MTIELAAPSQQAANEGAHASLALLMSALGESSRPQPAESERAPADGEWWAQKKRKRAISCGRCEACCREDCGKCLNCLDKPKFGGQGIRKQSCLSRKCHNSTSIGAPATAGSSAGQSGAKTRPESDFIPFDSTSMPINEWNDFWGAVQCCMRLADGHNGDKAKSFVPMAVIEERMGDAKRAKASHARQARCGSCAGCVRGDCGECKNCLDKPKYGGRGIKKQACLRRACLAAEAEPEVEEQSVVAAATTLASSSEGGFLSKDSSPALKPTEATEDLSSEPLLPAPVKSASKLTHSYLVKQSIEAQDKAGTAYSTADEEEASEDAAQALVMASRRPHHTPATSLLASAARVCIKRDFTKEVGEPFSTMLGATAALPKTAVV